MSYDGVSKESECWAQMIFAFFFVEAFCVQDLRDVSKARDYIASSATGMYVLR